MTQSESYHLSNPALLQKIDSLRERNIGQHVPLPQVRQIPANKSPVSVKTKKLVVVGDQSSGKSSLLESLTGIPFPRDVNLCTQHATQITSRRDQQTRVEFRIIPGPQASEEHKTNVQGYCRTLQSSKDLRGQFSAYLKEANIHMGIRMDKSSTTGTTFSEDILKIEICGPTEDYLTIIDVPGIFRVPTEGLTTKEDITLVNNLVREYIKDKRTIILAVLPSNVDIATQEIIRLAEEFDKPGERTLGVLTKPDLVTEEKAKISVCSLISGERKPLYLGYYLVRNRGADHDDNVKHEVLESTFQQAPWSSLPPDRVGISALKRQLEKLLAQITRREFPSLRKEVSDKLAECQADLNRLGPARPGEKEQRGYLNQIAQRFESYTRRALSAQYSHDRFFDKLDNRPVTQIVNLTEEFSHILRDYGHGRHFQDNGSPTQSGYLTPPTPTEPKYLHESLRNSLGPDSDVNTDEYSELDTFLLEQVEIKDPEAGIMEWIRSLYLNSRGIDLGTFSPDLLSAAFRQQSFQWDSMTRVFIGEVIRVIHHFIVRALHDVCGNDKMVKKILPAIIDQVLERYKASLTQAMLLVEIERSQLPHTLNRSFGEEVHLARGKRMRDMLKHKAWVHSKNYDEERLVINLDDVSLATAAKSNQEYIQDEIHDKLQSYYHLAVYRFMDNIFRQAVGYQLLSGPSSPLAVFSQEWVLNLDAKTLENIAGERDAAKNRRQILTKKMKNLKDALEILKV